MWGGGGGGGGTFLHFDIIKCKIFTVKILYTVKPKCTQTPSTFITLSQLIHYSL